MRAGWRQWLNTGASLFIKMGYVRFFLALSVMLGHAGIPTPLNPAFAVQLFFVISGYYMQKVLVGPYKDRLGAFYANRAIRLLPAYWAVALMTFAWLSFTGYEWGAMRAFKGEIPWSWFIVFSNVFLIGQDLVFVMKSGYTNLLVSPAWSIGMEVMFYAVAPMLAFNRKLIPWTVFLLALVAIIGGRWSFIIQGAQFVVNPKLYFWPLQFSFFMFGMLLGRYIEMPSGKIDRSLADLSYPLYLVHYPVMHFMSLGNAQYVIFTLALSWLIVLFVERPVSRLRDKIRPSIPQARTKPPHSRRSHAG